ncbi:hypothetical protein [Maricaulis sp.]
MPVNRDLEDDWFRPELRVNERKTVVERVIDRLRDLIATFDEGMG